jgi:hypothetical protein
MGSPCCLCITQFFFSFSVLSVLYQRKVGDHFFPELLVVIMNEYNCCNALKFCRGKEKRALCCSPSSSTPKMDAVHSSEAGLYGFTS